MTEGDQGVGGPDLRGDGADAGIRLGQFFLEFRVVASLADELLVVLQSGFQELLAQRLKPRQRRFEQGVFDSPGRSIHPRRDGPGCRALFLGLDIVGFRTNPLLFGPRTCLAQKDQTCHEGDHRRQ